MNLALKQTQIPSSIVSDPSIMSGEPIIRGTRIPADTIIAYLRSGYSSKDIFQDYPSLPLDGIDCVIEWAVATYGVDWNR
jgi:uncharacterized protein (DUF433 family)